MLEGRETAGTLRRHVRTWKLALRVPAQGTVAWEPVEWTDSMSLETQSSRCLPRHHLTELP